MTQDDLITLADFSTCMDRLSTGILEQYRTQGVALAVSGGVDSLCMAYLAKQWSDEQQIKLVALIVDHRLRPESSAEAIMVRQRLESKGIDSHILPWVGQKPKSNIQQLARTERYRLMTNYCKANDIAVLLTAHNSDDQAETIMMRITRGTGVTGLTGIKTYGMHNGIRVVRPMLEFSRPLIKATLVAAGWEWVEDPSNQDPKYTRSKVRQALRGFPDAQLLGQRCNLLARNVMRAEEYIQQQTDNFIQSYVRGIPPIATDRILTSTQPDELLTIDHQALCDAHEEIALRVLRVILQRRTSTLAPTHEDTAEVVGAEIHPPRMASLERLLQHLVHGGATTKRARTMGHSKIWAKKGLVYITAENN